MMKIAMLTMINDFFDSTEALRQLGAANAERRTSIGDSGVALVMGE